MELKTWLNSSGVPFENTAWITPPPYPYGAYLDRRRNRGADDLICVAEHDITVEIYTEFMPFDELQKVEGIFLEKAIPYMCFGTNWIDSEKHFQTVYEFSYTEKIKEAKECQTNKKKQSF